MKLLSSLVLLLLTILTGRREQQDAGHAAANNERADRSPALASAYMALIQIRNAELQAHWARYNIQAVLNLGFAVATLGARPNSFIGAHEALIAGAGIFLASVWLWFTWESKTVLTQRWDRHIKLFEKLYRDELPYNLFVLVHKEDESRWAGPLTVVQRLLPLAFIAAWAVYLVTLLCVGV